jgi:nickel/cobalt exporter
MRLRALIVGLAAGALIALLSPAPASAHPLGNFTVNRFAGLEVGEQFVTIHYVIDMAEIPTFQTAPDIDGNGNGELSEEELDEFAETLAVEVVGNLQLTADGAAVSLDVRDAMAELAAGQGGLDVLRIETDIRGRLPHPKATLAFNDANYAGRIGWKEIIAYTREGQGIDSSTVPPESPSNALRDYPRDLLSSPLDVTAATVRLDPSAPSVASGSSAVPGAPEGGDLFGEAFVGLVDGELSAGFLVVALLTAAGIGALHALGPGHGKAIMAAYLVGANGRVRHAVVVGTAISIMHTVSVLALGMITLWAASVFPPERVYPWLSFVSGVVVVGLGAYLLSARVRARRARVSHDHAHSKDHGHSSDHVHSHGHSHDHGFGAHSHALPADESPLSWKGLGALALSGGLLPSPSALIVLLAAVAIQRVAFGLTLVAAFSVGLAGSLTLLGILVLRARSFASRRMSTRAVAAMPVLSALFILTIGVLLTARAAAGL